MGLDLYSKVESYLDFQNEIKELHRLFCEIIEEIKPKTLLDLGCGQGDFMVSLPKEIQKKGIDLSENQVKICKEKGLNVQAIDIASIQENFEVITATFDVLNYIPKENLNYFVKNVYDKIQKNGYFIFDVNTKFAFEEIVTGAIVIDENEKFITIDANYDEPTLQTKITLFDKQNDGKFSKEQDSISQYYHSKELLKKVLKKSGFKIEALKEFHLFAYDMPDKLIYICKKD